MSGLQAMARIGSGWLLRQRQGAQFGPLRYTGQVPVFTTLLSCVEGLALLHHSEYCQRQDTMVLLKAKHTKPAIQRSIVSSSQGLEETFGGMMLHGC